MLEKYFKYFHYLMRYAHGIKTRNKKGSELHIYKFEGVRVAIVNDYENRRVLVWYFKEDRKLIYRVAYHGYHSRYLRFLVVSTVQKIQTIENYFEDVLSKRRSYSYQRGRAFKKFVLNKKK